MLFNFLLVEIKVELPGILLTHYSNIVRKKRIKEDILVNFYLVPWQFAIVRRKVTNYITRKRQTTYLIYVSHKRLSFLWFSVYLNNPFETVSITLSFYCLILHEGFVYTLQFSTGKNGTVVNCFRIGNLSVSNF